jgi:hypothetical protein
MADWFDFQTLTTGKGNVGGVNTNIGGAVLFEDFADSSVDGRVTTTYKNYGLFDHPNDQVNNVLTTSDFSPSSDYYLYFAPNGPNASQKISVGYNSNARGTPTYNAFRTDVTSGGRSVYELRTYADWIYAVLYSMKKECDRRGLIYPGYFLFKHDDSRFRFPILVGNEGSTYQTSPRCWKSSVWRSIVADSRYSTEVVYEEFDTASQTWIGKTMQNAFNEASTAAGYAGGLPYQDDMLYNGSDHNREFHRRMAPYFMKMYDYAMYKAAYEAVKLVFPNNSYCGNYEHMFPIPQQNATGTRRWENYYYRVYQPDENWKYWPVQAFSSKRHLRADAQVPALLPPKQNINKPWSYHWTKSLTSNSYASLNSITGHFTGSSNIAPNLSSTKSVHPFPYPGATSYYYLTTQGGSVSSLTDLPGGCTAFIGQVSGYVTLHTKDEYCGGSTGAGGTNSVYNSSYDYANPTLNNYFYTSVNQPINIASYSNLIYPTTSLLNSALSSYGPSRVSSINTSTSNIGVNIEVSCPGVTLPNTNPSLSANVTRSVFNYGAIAYRMNDSKIKSCLTGPNTGNPTSVISWHKPQPPLYPPKNNFNCTHCPDFGSPPLPTSPSTHQFPNDDFYTWNSFDPLAMTLIGVKNYVLDSKKWFDSDSGYYSTQLLARCFKYSMLERASETLANWYTGAPTLGGLNASHAHTSHTRLYRSDMVRYGNFSLFGGYYNWPRCNYQLPRPFPPFSYFDPSYVEPTPPTPLTITQVNNLQLTPLEQMTPTQVIVASGGEGSIRYTLVNGSLFTGLSLDTSTGVISGTPNDASQVASRTLTIRVSDAFTNIDRTITATLANPTPLSVSISNTTFNLTKNNVVTPSPTTIATYSNGVPPYTITRSGTLPTGLIVNGLGTKSVPEPISIQGIPTQTQATTVYTFFVRDSQSPSTQLPFTVNVTVDNPIETNLNRPSVSLRQGTAITPSDGFAPVTGAGGRSPQVYSVSPALPSGVNFSTSTGKISGTPTTIQTPTSHTVTFTDAISRTSSKSFNLQVAESYPVVSVSVLQSTVTVMKRVPMTPTQPILGSGGEGDISYSISVTSPYQLPSDLSISSTNGVVSGTPSDSISTGTFQIDVKAADGVGQTGVTSFDLVVQATTPITTSLDSSTLEYIRGNLITPVIPVSGSGGIGNLVYGISPALPNGLFFNTSTGGITGTPTSAYSVVTHTVSVEDSLTPPQTGTNRSFTLRVNEILTYSVNTSNVTSEVNKVLTSFTPITASGGRTPLVYSISPSLPSGLSLNTSTGEISGTPTVVSEPVTYTITVTDASSAVNQTITDGFTLEITPPPPFEGAIRRFFSY